jgi:MFS family permease
VSEVAARPAKVAATAVAAFLTDAAFYLVVFALTHALSATGATSRAVALVLGVYTLAYAVAAPVLGRLSDRFRFASVVAGASLFALVYLGLALSLHLEVQGSGGLSVRSAFGSPEALTYAAMSTLAIANALFWPALQARIGDRATDSTQLARSVRVFNVAWTSGKAVGFLIGGLLFVSSPQLCLWLVVGAGAVVLIAVLSEGDARRAAQAEPERLAVDQERKRAFLGAALIANFALWGAMNTLAGLAPKLAQGWQLSVSETGILLAMALAAQGLTFMALGSGRRWAYRSVTLLIALPAACAGLVLLALSASLLPALIGAVVVGAGQAVSYAASVFYSLDHDERRGFRTGIHEAVLAAGGAIPVVGGQIADVTGEILAPVWLILAVSVPASLAIAWLLLRAPAPGSEAPAKS